MNIFVPFFSPKLNAEILDNKRLVKMILETTQLLSNAMHINKIGNPPYKLTHKNHPCSKWISSNKQNYRYGIFLLHYLIKEYKKRFFNRHHKCSDYIYLFIDSYSFFPGGLLEPFPNCTTYKNMKNTHSAYKVYLCDKWYKEKNFNQIEKIENMCKTFRYKKGEN